MKHLVIGILAHVDSGKTTLSEALLYTAGVLRSAGRVDHGDTHLDTNAIERERGITIFSSQAVFPAGDYSITLLDTPGHVDFSAETERTLQVLDYAVLVINASDGVQSHTETLWELLQRYHVPTLIFVNKMDLGGTDRKQVLSELKEKFSDGCLNLQTAEDEQIAVCAEGLLEEFLEKGSVSRESIRKAIQTRDIFPCWFGSALKMEGIREFYEEIPQWLSEPERNRNFGAKVYKIMEGTDARVTFMKVTGGRLTVKSLLEGTTKDGTDWKEKVNQIRIYSGEKYTTTDIAETGELAAVTGLSLTYPGEGIGSEPETTCPFLQPVLNYEVLLPAGTDAFRVYRELALLGKEDPALEVEWDAVHSRTRMKLMGEVQLEVIRRVIAERFGISCEFGKGSVSYRETVTEAVEGIGHYEPLRHYAEVHLLLEPLPAGSGLAFTTICSEDRLERNWQRLILTHLQEKIHTGPLTGSPITDMRITLIAGKASTKHTEGGDFRQATYRAVRHGLRSAKCRLLEPWSDFTLRIPSQSVGRAMNDLQRMHAESFPPETEGMFSVLRGTIPVASSRGYASEVLSYTGGLGHFTTVLRGYAPCHNEEEIISEFAYNPDADTENPADSIFCQHGAGTIVHWQDVSDYAHVDSGLRLGSAGEPEEERRGRAEHFGRVLATDEELRKIFERTYGPLKQPEYGMRPKPEKTVAAKPYRAKPIPEGPEYLLVDGYNIIFAWTELKQIASQNLESARVRLMDLLCNYQAYRQCELILVFDAYKVKGNPGSVEHYHNISVVYTKEAETADMYIEKTTNALQGKRRVRVATSDGLEQVIILGHGALRVPASAFEAEVKQAMESIRGFLH